MPQPPTDIADAVRYVLHRMYVGRALWSTTDKGYTILNAALLQSVTRKYKPALEWCVVNGVAMTDAHYVVGQKSRGYRWTASYEDATREQAGDVVGKAMDRVSRKTHREYHKTHRHLLRWLRRITFDAVNAKEVLDGLDRDHPVWQEREATAAMASLLANGYFEFSVCNYGRVHTPITRLARELRCCVTVDGESLVSVDISNSQPLVLSSLLLSQYSGGCVESDLSPCLNPILGAVATPFPFRSSAAIPPAFLYDSKNSEKTSASTTPAGTYAPKQLAQIPADVTDYVRHCENGDLYESLMIAVGEPITPESRRRFKEDFFEKVFFGRMKVDWKITKAFRQRFPNVLDFIETVKAKDYKTLAWEMQRQESRIMIDRVCHRIMEERPDMPLLTIHDSILTTEENIEYAKQTITREFAAIGLRPSLKVERTDGRPGMDNGEGVRPVDAAVRMAG